MEDAPLSDQPESQHPGAFPTTEWSVVLKAGQTNAPEAAFALQKLCQIYWRPIYTFIRRRNHGAHEAEDLTQSYIAHMLENDVFKSVERQGGRFRSFLLAGLQNFLANQWDRTCAAKRGGKLEIVSWDGMNAEERLSFEPANSLTPEVAFERRWALLIVERALKRMADEFAAAGRSETFDHLQPFLTREIEPGDYARLGERLAMGEGALKTALHRLRRKFGEALRREVAHTVATEEDIEDEMRHLLGSLAA